KVFCFILNLFFVLFWKSSRLQELLKNKNGRRGDGGAFFAMRSCQQLLHADGGEFFSPDYLCSNPPLWCNWTIQVDPAKRIHLHLEDMTPDDDCLLKEDQLHVDEPAGGFRTHRVLQKCWREAKYTSSSNTLYVVLLIGGWPSPPYRGFYGRYQAFGPLVVYNPHEEFTETNEKSEPSAGLMDFNEIVMNEEQMDSDLVEILHLKTCEPGGVMSDASWLCVCRLSTGVLYILWLQIGQEHGGPQVHQVLHSGLQGLITAGNDVSGNRRKAVLISVSIAGDDVNECGTQLVLCDVNADCLNQFGSYSCRCKPGFQDKSRQGPGGTICLDLSLLTSCFVCGAGCSSGLSAETKAVYVLFFLLSFLILMLLVAAGLLYHRHHRGEFLVRCDGSGSRPDPVDRHRHHDDCDLPPPPPPPARGFRESWPQAKERYPVADLPLLSFSPLLPPDYKERKLGKSDPKS
uniref:EGF-like domain-containing protein n=1 Tax=Cyclopterus lumpus TaxID=8103 RepID=A0A8C2ZHA3_CYCLU